MSTYEIMLIALFTLMAAIVVLAWFMWTMQPPTKQLLRRLLPGQYRRLETSAVERGERGLMAALSLYRERVARRLTQPEVFGPLGTFSLNRMYIPLELELSPVGSESVTYGQPQELLRMHLRLVILGPPGAGKTTMLHHVELLTTRGQVPGVPDLPVFIPVARLALSANVVDCALQLVRDRYHINLQRPQLVGLLKAGLVLLLLDGLDEVGPGSRAYRAVWKEIRTLIQEFPATPIILSCRTAAWEKPLPEFREATIPALDQETIRRFIVARFPSDASDQVESLYRIIGSSRSLNELAKTPLLLSFMVELYSRNTKLLPKSRLQLYQQCTDLLLYHWDTLREIKRPTQIPRHLKYQLLKRLGLLFQKEQITISSCDELMSQVAEWFQPQLYGPPEPIISEIEIAHGMLVRAGSESYAFLHITFQQYFAALELAEVRPLPRYLLQNIHNPWWREVVLLLSAMGRADEVVGIIVDDLKADRTISDARHSKLLLAAECIRDSSFVNAPLRLNVFYELQRMFSRGDAHTTYQAAMALTGLGRHQVEKFLEEKLSAQAIPSHRVAAVLALAEFGKSSAEIVDTLVESLHADQAETRTRAALALGQLGSPKVLDPLLSAFAQDESAQARAEMLRAINRIVEVPQLDTAVLALTIKTLRAARQDPDLMVSELATELLGRLSSRVQE